MDKYETHKEAFENAKKLVKHMYGLSDAGFENRYINDPLFNEGFNVITKLYASCPKSKDADPVITSNYSAIKNSGRYPWERRFEIPEASADPICYPLKPR